MWSSVIDKMSDTASTSNPIRRSPSFTTMMTWRAVGSCHAKLKPRRQIHDRQHRAAKINHAAYIVRRVRQRRRWRPAANFAYSHDIDAKLLLADMEGDQFAALIDDMAWLGHDFIPLHKVLVRARCGASRSRCRYPK